MSSHLLAVLPSMTAFGVSIGFPGCPPGLDAALTATRPPCASKSITSDSDSTFMDGLRTWVKTNWYTSPIGGGGGADTDIAGTNACMVRPVPKRIRCDNISSRREECAADDLRVERVALDEAAAGRCHGGSGLLFELVGSGAADCAECVPVTSEGTHPVTISSRAVTRTT